MTVQAVPQIPGVRTMARDVLALMAEGRSNGAIAAALAIAERAVEKHVANISPDGG